MLDVVLGQGKTACATARYLRAKQVPFQIYSLQKNKLPSDLVDFYTAELPSATRYWLSPGIPPNDPLYTQLDVNVPKVLDVSYFLAQTKARVIAVTGTNGKSTVCAYIASMLSDAGYNCGIFGNYQPGLLDALAQDYDWVVIELSSFQLHYLPDNTCFDAVVITNIAQDHMAWHQGLAGYQQAKHKICRFSDIVVTPNLPDTIHYLTSPSKGIAQENIACAKTVLQSLGMAVNIGRLPALPFRMQKVMDVPVIINDSKSTNLHATYAALIEVSRCYPNKPVVLIMAGIAKDECSEDLKCLIQAMQVTLWIVGDGHPLMKDIAHEAVETISEVEITKNDAVTLFSPGGSSYDYYKDYIERGKDFDNAIQCKMGRT